MALQNDDDKAQRAIDGRLSELEALNEEALLGGGTAAIERQHERG